MALQKVFKKSYMTYLRDNIKVDDYMEDSFPYDEDQCVQIAGVIAPDYDLNKKLDPTPEGDLQSAIAIFEAYPNLTPIFAQQDDLWVYLSHADLFDYVKKRWPDLGTVSSDKQLTYIQNHWFHNPNNFLRTSFAGLWWHTYFTIDEKREDKYELTKVFFQSGQDFRTLRFGEIALIRSKEAMIGVLEFLLENKDLIESNFVARGQYISRYFNKLGAYKQLAYLDRSFFKNELYKKLDVLRNLHSTDQIQNQSIEL